MKIQHFGGGLANQIRQYVFVRYAQRQYPNDIWFYDDTAYFVTQIHNGYELNRIFGLKLNLLSQYYSQDVWERIVENRSKGVILPQTLLDMGAQIVLFEGRVNAMQKNNQAKFSGEVIFAKGEHLGFHPEYIDLPYENIYYHAEWASRKWFDAYAEENRKELQFPTLSDKWNLEYADRINAAYSIGIHVRRTGFLDTNLDLSVDQYLTACKQVLEVCPKAHFFVFSDDLQWCQANAELCGFNLASKTTYIKGNVEANNYVDMQLLSMCNGMIRNAESSFSQVAGWLNPKLEFDYKILPEQNISDARFNYKISTLTAEAQELFGVIMKEERRLYSETDIDDSFM